MTLVLNRYRLKKMNVKEQFIMAYGGLRGAVGFSLVIRKRTARLICDLLRVQCPCTFQCPFVCNQFEKTGQNILIFIDCPPCCTVSRGRYCTVLSALLYSISRSVLYCTVLNCPPCCAVSRGRSSLRQTCLSAPRSLSSWQPSGYKVNATISMQGKGNHLDAR